MAAPNLRTLFQIIGITLVEESVSGLRDDLYKGTDILAPGDRVMHGKHGLGVVMRTSPEGRLSVTFDSGSVHVYKRSSVAKKITRAPIDAPSPPESMQQQPIAALNSSKRRRSSTTPRRSVIVRPGRKSVASNQGLDVVEVGRLLLTWEDLVHNTYLGHARDALGSAVAEMLEDRVLPPWSEDLAHNVNAYCIHKIGYQQARLSSVAICFGGLPRLARYASHLRLRASLGSLLTRDVL